MSRNSKDIPKFVADVMLGSLSHWLRLFGFDTLYRNDFTDKELIKISLQQERILLTRDRALVKSKLLNRKIFINSENLEEQIKEVLRLVLRELCLMNKEKLSALAQQLSNGSCQPNSNYHELINLKPRCPICNGETERIGKNQAAELVPDFVAISNDDFLKCKNCGKIYWHGTHKEKIDETKKRIFISVINESF
ncbi:Mut7-C RNAse domain-containing protein [Thermodesulfovibrio hydrogeniphilus]